jgi:hypothetical protein
MAVSLGYFAFDFIVVVAFRVPLFPVFIAHHIFASLPFYLHLFVDRCDFGTLALASFLTVELATVFLNVQAWCETIVGHRNTALYRILFMMTYISWIVSRLGVPVFCIAIWYKYLLLDDADRDRAPLGCLIPMTICGHIILLFCYAVFLGLLTPEFVQILRGVPPEGQKLEAEMEAEMEGAERREPTHEGETTAATPRAPSRRASRLADGLPPPLHAAELHFNTTFDDITEEASALRASLAAHSA